MKVSLSTLKCLGLDGPRLHSCAENETLPPVEVVVVVLLLLLLLLQVKVPVAAVDSVFHSGAGRCGGLCDSVRLLAPVTAMTAQTQLRASQQDFENCE